MELDNWGVSLKPKVEEQLIKKMEGPADNIVQMNPGDGKTSYAKNSAYQRSGISKSLPMLNDALENMLADPRIGYRNCYKLVDFGCSSGPNSLWAMTHVIDKIKKCREKINVDFTLEFEVYLNDLPDNDFNSLFKFIPGLFEKDDDDGIKKGRRVMYYGLPGSFYRRLFGEKTLHFAYSSYSLHWLSQVPKGLDNHNKENIYVAEESSLEAREAYSKQFERDFSTFLKLRGEEMVQGGHMVLLFSGTNLESPYDDCANITLLAKSLFDMAKEGLVKMEDLYSFNMPLYRPCKAEVDAIIENEGSFNVDTIQDFRDPWVPKESFNNDDSDNDNNKRAAKLVAHGIRCVMESMLTKHFGSCIVDAVFERYEKKVEEHMLVNESTLTSIVISLTRK